MAGVTGAGLLALLGGVWLLRAPIAGAVAHMILERRGVEATFEITRLDTSGLALRDLRLGDGVVVPRLELDYRIGDLLDGRLRAVRATRPQIRIDLADEGITVAGFRLDGGGAAGGAGAPAVELVSVTNALVTLASEAGELPLQMNLEGGPQQGWRGWAVARPGAAAWRDWGAQLREGEIEFEMIGDDVLARVSLALDDAHAPQGAARAAMLAATVRLSGLRGGVAAAQGEAAMNMRLEGARAADPQEMARRLLAVDRWAGAPGAGPLADPLAARAGATLAAFDAQIGLLADVTPRTVGVSLQIPATLRGADGPDLLLRAVGEEVFPDGAETPILLYGRDGRGWRAQARLDVRGDPDLTARLIDVRFAPGEGAGGDGAPALAALRFEGDLASFGTAETRVAAQDAVADWTRTDDGWRAEAAGAVSASLSAFDMTAQDARLNGAVTVTSTGDAIRVRPAAPGGMLDLTAATLALPAGQFRDVAATLAPILDVADGRWRLTPEGAPARLSAASASVAGMQLSGLRLTAPRGLTLDGQGAVFTLDPDAPLSLALAQIVSASWTARGVEAGSVRGADGPLLQRTEGGETFLNALATPARADTFALVSDTTFREIAAPSLRLSGAVTPEMMLDATAPDSAALVDTLGQRDMALRAGEMNATLTLAPETPLEIAFAMRDGTLGGGTLALGLEQAALAGRAAFGAELAAEIGIARVVAVTPGEPAMVTPTTLAGDLRVAAGRAHMTMAGAPQGAPQGALTIDLTHDLTSGLGQANIDIPRIVFARGGTQPQDVIPMLKGFVASVEGPAEAHFLAQWYGTALSTSGVLVLDNLDVATRFGPIEDVSTRFEMTSLAPLLTAAPQTISMGLFNPGVPVQGGEIRLSLLPQGRIGLDSARWPFAGGAISVDPFVWDPEEPDHRLSLAAERISLGQLVGLFGNESLNAGGAVSGRMPLLVNARGLAIENARLTGDTGFVAYRGQASDAAAQANEQASLAFRALENLQYRVLEVTLDGPLDGQMQMNAAMEGFNPDVLDGFPFRFRIGLSADFMRLLRDTTQGFRIREQIERGLQQEAGAAPPADNVALDLSLRAADN